MDRTPVNSRQAVRQAWKTGSPFQVRKANQRPKLRFGSPIQTDNWLSEREKTDYTYARSASYSSSVVAKLKTLEELAISYITPILSRRSRDPVMRPDEVPVTSTRTPRRRIKVATPTSTRRSARLAAQNTRGTSTERDASAESYGQSRHITTTTTTTTAYSAYGSTVVHADDSPRSSLSNGTEDSWKSRNRTDSGANHRSFSERLHVNNRDKYMNHLYGLDEDDYGGEYSDTESSLAATRSSSFSTASSWETHQCEDEQSTLSSVSFITKTALLSPFYILYWLTTSILTVISTVVFRPAAAVIRTVQKSSDVSSLFYSLYSLSSRCVHFCSVLLYRFFTSILLWDVWALTRIRELFLGFLGTGYAATASAVSSTTSSYSTTTIISEAERVEKERRRRGCCLCLLLLLLLPFLFYLLLGAAPILLAALNKNETKVEETFDESAFFAASGCLKCLRKDELMLLIGGVVKDQVAGLHSKIETQHSQIETQNQRILMLQQVRAEHESHIQTLRDQLALLISKQDTPNKETLVFINSLETQLTSLRGELRKLQMAQAQQDKDSDKEMIGIAALGLLRTDVGNMEEDLAALKVDLNSFHNVYNSDFSRLQSQDRHLHGDVNIIGSRVLALEKRVSSDMNSLERRLGQLQQALQGLDNGRMEDSAELELMAVQIGMVEGNMTSARNELRELRAELAAAVVSADKVKELESKMALNADVEVLRTQLTDLQSLHTDDVKALQDLESRYQSVHSSFTNLQIELSQLQGHVQDIDANKYGVISLSLEQLQKRLSELEKNSHDLKVSMQQVQDASGDKADAAVLVGLQNNFSELETKLGNLRTELQTFTDRVTDFTSRINVIQTDQERHESSTSAIFGTIREDIVSLQDKSKDVVNPSTLEINLNSMRTDVQTSTDKMSSDISALRTDLHRLEVVEGSSKLVGDVTKLQAVLESVRTQLQGLDTSNTGSIEPTVAVDLAELRSDIEHTTREVQRNQASLTSMNGTILVLQQGHQEQVDSTAVIAKDLESLREELSAMMLRVEELNTAQDNQKLADTIHIETSTLQSHLQNVKADVESLQHQLAQLSAKSASKKEYQILVGDMSTLQAAVLALQEQFVSEEGGDINIVQLVNRVNTLGALVETHEKSGAFAGGAFGGGQGGDAMETEKLQGSLDSVQDELSRLKRDLTFLNGTIYVTGKDGESQNVLADIATQLGSVEASLENLRSSQQGINAEMERKIGAIETLMGTLRDQLMKLQSDVTDTFGAAAGASVRDDLVDVKANLSDLNEQQIKLLAQIKDCCNKSQLAEIYNAGGFTGKALNWTDSDGLDEEKVRSIVLNALTLYSADKTGMVDYALESAGGAVVSTRCSETFTPRTALFTIMGIPLWYDNSSPRSVIQPDMHPGNCWAFKGSEGYLVIQLSGMIKPTAFSMEHIPKSLSPTGTIDSAPRSFSVWALHNEYDTEGVLIGRYEYDQDGNALQFFAVHDSDMAPTRMIELKIHSNQGNLEYTCLYRFRVHGTLQRD